MQRSRVGGGQNR
jgi:hypothetical protein